MLRGKILKNFTRREKTYELFDTKGLVLENIFLQINRNQETVRFLALHEKFKRFVVLLTRRFSRILGFWDLWRSYCK